MARLAAFIVLLIPGIIAAGGIKIMRDSLFGILFNHFRYLASIYYWIHHVCCRTWFFCRFSITS